MKKPLSLLLALVLFIGVFPEAAAAEHGKFKIDSAHTAATEISGDDTSGYTFTLSGSGKTRIITPEPQPFKALSFDYGYAYDGNSFGIFGISFTGSAESSGIVSDESNLVFSYRVASGACHIYLMHSDGEKEIGIFSAADRAGDAFWTANVSNFSFVESGGHLMLSVDGNVCGNVSGNERYSYLENIIDVSAYSGNANVYIVFGGYNSGTVYFKQLSAVSEDNAWESRAVDSFRYYYGNRWREYRGNGNTESTVHSAIPAAAVGSRTDGHIADLTGTDGYIQSAQGFDLKNTAFEFAPVTYDGNNSGNLWYYIGFTANPAKAQYHSKKPCDTVEFRAVSVYDNNQTEGYAVTNQSGCLAEPDEIYLGKLLTWRTHRYENTYKTTPARLVFVNEIGADGNKHWYMKTVVSGNAITVKSENAETDKFLQFDSVIDKPVYFRIGTDGMNTSASFRVYAKITDTSGNGSGGWQSEEGETEAKQKSILSIKQAWLNGSSAGENDYNGDGKVNVVDTADLLLDISAAERAEDCTVLNIGDFGAVGDGVTDDAAAVAKAISALNALGKNAKLVFERNKTYYCKNDGAGGDIVFSLKNTENVHIVGNNTTIITEAPMRMLRTFNTVDCSVEGFNFDYGIRPYFMAEKAESIDTAAGTCIMKIGEGMAEKYLGLTEIGQSVSVKVNGNNATAFGIIESKTGRYHMFISGYELAATDKIKIYFVKSANQYTAAWMPKLKTERLVCPTPGVGHMVEHAFHFNGDSGLAVKNVNLYSACRFAAALMNAEGRITFDNFNITPNPALKGTFEETDFTAWRDGWHLKENRARVVWRNCSAAGLQDDVFNISSSIMYIKDVISEECINMYWPETGGVFRAALKAGDEITVINSDTGEIIGKSEIKRAVRQQGSDNIVTLSKPIKGLTAGKNIKVLFEGLAAADSLIKDCSFSGTFRFRGKLTVLNTDLECKRMWLDILTSSWLEGPVPHDILFKDCRIGFEAEGTYVHASAYNENTSDNSYHIKNIAFDSCTVDSDCFEIGTGDEVIFKNCTK